MVQISRARKILTLTLVQVFFLYASTALLCKSTYAIDKRLERPLVVLGKTTAVGAGLGLVGGAAGAALLGGGIRTVGKATSLGLYAGLIFGLFVLVAPPEAIYGESPIGKDQAPQPSRLRHKKDYDDWEDEGAKNQPRPAAPLFWAPVLSAQF